jgi:ABC-type molybdate transport system substrate-binding protein
MTLMFAASSLTNVFEESARELENSRPGLRVLTSYASSSTPAARLGEGETADVFASNRLVVVTPADNPAGVRSFEDPGISKPVRSFEIPDRFNAVAGYPIAVPKSAARKETAAAFVELVPGAKANKILAGRGFGGPAECLSGGLTGGL